jgi:transcriptional regulator with XRE-family HTH domain
MKEYKKVELEILNIQIGCILRHARLLSKLSQQDLGMSLGYTSVMIGRVERFENISGWDKIFFIAEKLEVDFHELFILKTKNELLTIIEESFKLEVKLNQEKRDYYEFLKKTIIRNYDLLSKLKKDA